MDTRLALLLAVAPLGALLIVLTSLTTLDLLIISAPFMFSAGLTGPLHLSASDLVFPALALSALVSTAVLTAEVKAMARYCVAAVTWALFSALYASLADPGFLFSLAAQTVVKMVVGLAYALMVAIWATHASGQQLLRSFRIWTWVATLLAVGSVITAVGVATLVPWDGTRSLGYFQDPNLYAGYLLLSAVVVVLAETLEPSRWSVWQLLALSAGVLATGSRAAVVTFGALVAGVLVLITARKIRIAAAIMGSAILAVVVALFTSASATASIPALARLAASSAQAEQDPRLGLWMRAVDLWQQHPLVGVGLGQFGRFSIDVNGIAGGTGVGYIAHNSFLSFLAEQGLPGFLLAVGGVAWIVHRAATAPHLSRNTRSALVLGLMVLVLQALSLNLQNIRYLWIFVGLVVALSGVERIGPRPTRRAADRRALAGGSGAVEPSTPAAAPMSRQR